MKLISISPSTNVKKKLMAVFEVDKKMKTVHFGSKDSSDFTKSGDEKAKTNYLARHRVREDWTDPLTAGALSRFILWNKSTLRESIADFKKRFNL